MATNPKRQAAIEILQKELADGPRPASEIRAAGTAAGVSERTLKRARAELGVLSIKGCAQGLSSPWLLELPKAPQKPKRHPGWWMDAGARDWAQDAPQAAVKILERVGDAAHDLKAELPELGELSLRIQVLPDGGYRTTVSFGACSSE